MGRVYLARSPGGRMVAVKVIRANLAEDAGFRARFAREVAAARKVGGLFTAQVVDADLDGPIPWLVTAYVPGTSLSDAVEQQGPLPPQSVLALAAGLAEGLIAIHAAGVIHRDLKPSNVLLAQDGPRIIDFGISSAAEATALTGTGYMIGSPGFMSPEQAEGLTVGSASDIFSLAGVLIYAARGEGPFGIGDTAALLYRVVHGKPNIDQVPDNLRPLIRRSLSRDAKRRPTATEFLADLSAAYPSAADLTDWLPPRVVSLSGQRAASADPSAGQPAAAGTFGPAFAAGPSSAGAGVARAGVAGAGAIGAAGAIASPDSAAENAEPVTGGSPPVEPTRTSLAHTPLPPSQAPGGSPGFPGPQSYSGTPGYAGPQDYPGQQEYSGQQGYSGPQGYPAPQGYSGAQQYPAPQGYSTGQGDAIAPGGPGIQAPGNPWWAAQQQPGGPPGSMPPTPPPGLPAQGAGSAADQWYRPPTEPNQRGKRPRWLVPVGGAAVILVVVVALVLALGGHPAKTPVARQSSSPAARPSPSRSVSPTANSTPTVGNLQLAQFQVGDCLTGSNMDLNKNTPWPKLTEAIPCGQSHTAEVFYSNINFWPKNEPYPGDTAIKNQANAECNNAFASYDGIAYSKSQYTWTNVVPDASTWPNPDRALHCIAYYATPSQPAGVAITGSIKGTKK
jgi:Protein kinase domain/Septum formation